jgi:hypothetical protein
MVAISEFLKINGYGPASGEHLGIPGIWKKLGTLYNLEALNERVSKLPQTWRILPSLANWTFASGGLVDCRYQ